MRLPPGVSQSMQCRKRIRGAIELDEDTIDRVDRANARRAKIQASASITETSEAALSDRLAASADVRPSGRILEVAEAETQRFPGAVEEAITADPGSVYDKLSGASTANRFGSHSKGNGICKQTAKLDKESRNAMMKLVAEDLDVSEIYSP